jgi:hypothetical protein
LHDIQILKINSANSIHQGSGKGDFSVWIKYI